MARHPEKIDRVFGRELAGRFEILQGDMTDERTVARALPRREAVIHAAAFVALERKHAARVLEDNRRGIENVVGRAVTAGIDRVIYVSSVVAFFGHSQRVGQCREADHDGRSAYTQSKFEGDTYVRALQATGAPVRTTYPAAVLGPDDPGLSEANRGILAFFRDAQVVTEGGLQMVDVRDVAKAHVLLLETPVGAGHHTIEGHFLSWARLVDLLEEITGRKLRRLHIPGAVVRASGVVADLVKHVWDFDFPISAEAMRMVTQWVPVTPARGETSLGVIYRDPRETLRDTLRWMHAAGHLPAAKLGKLRN